LIPGEVLGLSSTNRTRGHRFMSTAPIEIPSADAYLDRMNVEGRVIVDFNQRRNRIAEQLKTAASKNNASLVTEHDALLEEVTALVEYPVTYQGQFEAGFLEVPQECLILSMQQHQKYFPLLERTTGKLLSRFLIVSNLESDNPTNIVKGNERVLRARLS